MQLRGAKPGRFGPRCSACKAKFLLVVHPPESGRAPEVRPMPEAAVGAAHASPAESVAGIHATADATMPEPPAHLAPPPQQHRPRPATDVTAAPPPSVTRAGPAHAGRAPHRPAATFAGADVTAAEVPRPHSVAPAATSIDPDNADVDLALGGYQVVRRLGQGGMGQVFLAKQLSLDRHVALKTLAPNLAADPSFVARFTREAYAAAQLTHHNVVQIHDIGIGRDTRGGRDVHFFSMEYVEGASLAGTAHKSGRLDPEVAAGYVLQAARGLKFAHDHGLIHRDVKPDNLLLNDQGLVKVADLGLVKVAGGEDEPATVSRVIAGAPLAQDTATAGHTQLNVSMGTPAYMPPEQARDAAHVDQRADVYSLGCTLYDLLTGHPPFEGRTAYEVITKHSTQPLVPPDRVARHVPPRLSAIVVKMTAKRPADRYQSMGEVVEALEQFLGVESGKAFNPQEQAVRELEDAVTLFNRAKWAGARDWTVRGFFAVCGLGALLCALPQIALYSVAAGFVGFAGVATVFYQLIVGVTQRTVLFKTFRQFLFGTRLTDWLRALLFVVVCGGLLYVFQLHWVMLGFAAVALLTAAAFHFVIDRLVAAERDKPLADAELMLRRMRLTGLDENALRQFVCKYAGERWEAFYEALFGYEAMRAARRAWGKGDRGRDRKKHAAWRDPLIDFFDRRIEQRKLEKERRLLQKIEQKVLTARGVDEGKAAQDARRAAERFMRRASVVRETAERRAAETAAPAPAATARPAWETAPSLGPSWIHDLAAQPLDDHLPGHRHESYLKRRYGGPLDVLVGRGVRFVLAAVLLAGFGIWLRQNSFEAVVAEGAKVIATTVDPVDTSKGPNVSKAKEIIRVLDTSNRPQRELRVTGVPTFICDAVGSWNGGLAGLVLLLSCVFVGKKYGAAVILAAGITLFIHRLGLPMLRGQPALAAAAGVAMLVASVMFLRRRE
jgi:serine/threonine protein kinase